MDIYDMYMEDRKETQRCKFMNGRTGDFTNASRAGEGPMQKVSQQNDEINKRRVVRDPRQNGE